MSQIVIQRVLCAVLAGAFLSVPRLDAQKTPAPPIAPVPTQIGAAKTAFISNAGLDSMSRSAFERLGQPDLPYNALYAAMKGWGRYALVAAPADADLVLEIRFTAPLTDCGGKSAATYAPQLDLAILDARTHFLLWAFTEPVRGAFLKGTWEKNVNEGINALAEDVKKLAARAAADPAAR